MKRKLLIVAGAGASIEFGMPSVSDIDKLFMTWSQELLPLAKQPDENLYSYIKQALSNYYSNNPGTRKEVLLNFEHLLYTIQSLYQIMVDRNGRFNHKLNAFITLLPLPEIVRFGEELGATNSDDLHSLHSRLVDKLLIHIRDKSKNLVANRPQEVLQLGTFIDELSDVFKIGIVNLNYDNVILKVSKDLQTGFDPKTGEFEKRRVLNDSWDFLYHLHGSCHFDMRGKNTDMHQIYWNHDLNSSFSENSSGRSGNFTSEGNTHLQSNIITGLDKTNQILREPFLTYYSQLVQLAFYADAILIMGYGFGDIHLNKCFRSNRFDSKKRNVVIIDYADMNEGGLEGRHDAWTFGLGGTFPLSASQTSRGLLEPVAHYRASKTFEKASIGDFPLSVWYDGLLSACNHSKLVLEELND